MDKKELTPKQEKFCQGIIAGLNYTDAYKQAYTTDNMKPATINNKAYELLKNGEITARINELKAKTEEKLIYSALQSFKRFGELGLKAEADNNYSAAIKAEENRAKLAGLFIERIAQTDTNGNDIEKPIVSNEEILEIMQRRANERNGVKDSSK